VIKEIKSLLDLPLTFEERINIILAKNGMKGGSINIPKSQTFLNVMEELFNSLNLSYKKEEKPKTFRLLFTKYSEDLKKINKEFTQRKEKIRVLGEFYKYPECCVEKFIKGKSWSILAPSYKTLLPYIYHEFCSPTCDESTALNEIIKKTIVRELGNEYRLAFLLSKFTLHYDYWPYKVCRMLSFENILRSKDKLRHVLEPYTQETSPIYMKSIWILEKPLRTFIYEAHLIRMNRDPRSTYYKCLFDTFETLEETKEKKIKSIPVVSH